MLIAAALVLAALGFALLRGWIGLSTGEPTRPSSGRVGGDDPSSRPVIHRPISAPPAARDGENGRVVGASGYPAPHKTGADSIRNEFVFRFKNADDMAQFLRAARGRGVEVLGTLDKLVAVRVRVRDLDQLAELLHDAPHPDDWGNNHWFHLPDPRGGIVKLPEGVYTAFGDTALAWLGVTGDHSNWGQGVTVAILDTGIVAHPTLSSQRITTVDLLGTGASALGEHQGHGTAVASIVAGADAQAAGVAPSANLLAIRVAGGDGTGNAFTVAWGIIEAVDRGADVISLSMSSQGDSFILQEAIAYATGHGVVIVASTGNDAIDQVGFPARYDSVLAVTAVDANSRHLYFANRGEEVDLAAPGLGVNAAWTDNQVVGFNGTSAATPFVAGAIAALMSGDPNLAAIEAADLLVHYSNDAGAPGEDDELGAGVLDVARAMERDRTGVFDMAIAAHYYDPASGSLLVSAQNRGTERIVSVRLEVVIDGTKQTHNFLNVDVGAVIHEQYFIDTARLRQAGRMEVISVVIPQGVEDARPGNNARRSVLAPPPE